GVVGGGGGGGGGVGRGEAAGAGGEGSRGAGRGGGGRPPLLGERRGAAPSHPAPDDRARTESRGRRARLAPAGRAQPHARSHGACRAGAPRRDRRGSPLVQAGGRPVPTPPAPRPHERSRTSPSSPGRAREQVLA